MSPPQINGHSPSPSDVTEGFKTDATTLASDDNDKDVDPYPDLGPGAQEKESYEDLAWTAAGLRFAPPHVPLLRRLETLAVLFHCTAIVFLNALFFFLCANPFMWPLIIPYLVHLVVSGAATDGKLRYRNEYIRSLRIWKLFASYFPTALHKTYDLDPTRKYIFGYHPHGIISHGGWAAFATNALGFKEKFPGITNTLLTLDANFKMPLYRDWLLAMGLRSVSRESIWNLLTRGGSNGEGMGRAVTIVIGGARESLEAQPGTLKLIVNGRKGFIKMALRTGADIVPVLGFGENDLYDQLSPKTNPMVHKFQMFCLKVFKFTLPALYGRGVINYDIGLMPYRRPMNIVVGKPIKVTQSAIPEQAEIDRLHGLYVAELQNIWDAYKNEFAKDRKSEIQFID
jgi:2-acylglycerol O-acyltransferase 2